MTKAAVLFLYALFGIGCFVATIVAITRTVHTKPPLDEAATFHSCECDPSFFRSSEQGDSVIDCYESDIESRLRLVDDIFILCVWNSNPSAEINKIERVALVGDQYDYSPIDNGIPDIFTHIETNSRKSKLLISVKLDRSWFPVEGSHLTISMVEVLLVQPDGTTTSYEIHPSEERALTELSFRRFLQSSNTDESRNTASSSSFSSSSSSYSFSLFASKVTAFHSGMDHFRMIALKLLASVVFLFLVIVSSCRLRCTIRIRTTERDKQKDYREMDLDTKQQKTTDRPASRDSDLSINSCARKHHHHPVANEASLRHPHRHPSVLATV